jgi:hypothetical protein
LKFPSCGSVSTDKQFKIQGLRGSTGKGVTG